MPFEYALVSRNRYLSLRQSPFILLWLLVRKRALMPDVFAKRTLAKFLRARFISKQGMQLVLLPVNGTWCREVRGGFKVFDVGRRSVIKIYAPGTDKEMIRRDVELFSKVGQHDFAPLLKDWNIDEGWYEEEFVEGLSGYRLIPKSFSSSIENRYSTLIEPLLEKMILAGSPEPVVASTYLETLESSLRARNARAGDEDGSEAYSFIEEATKKCRALVEGTRLKIYLVFCHGDFHQRNMFWVGDHVKLIDWEGAQRLSLLFDFFNFFFSQAYLRNSPLDCPEEIKDGVGRIASRISAQAPQASENLIQLGGLYRLLYYIERIHTFLSSFDLDGLRIRRWIDLFREFEKEHGELQD